MGSRHGGGSGEFNDGPGSLGSTWLPSNAAIETLQVLRMAHLSWCPGSGPDEEVLADREGGTNLYR
jgi:hypothetical protein